MPPTGPRRVFVALVGTVAMAAACGGGGQSAADARREAQATWESFFNDHQASVDAKVRQLQDGDDLEFVLDVAANHPDVKKLSVVVKGVDVLKKAQCRSSKVVSPCARVTYDLSVAGRVVLADSVGFAVRQDHRWKVSKLTFCTLVSMANGEAPKACAGAVPPAGGQPS